MAALFALPQLPAALRSQHSTESSPPPSPTNLPFSQQTDEAASQAGVAATQLKHEQSLLSLVASNASSTNSDSAESNSRHPSSEQQLRARLPGRQETPPSPPNSLLVPHHENNFQVNPTPPLPMEIVTSPTAIPSRASSSAAGRDAFVEPTPPSSFKDRFTRVFKSGHRRQESDASQSTVVGFVPSSEARSHRPQNSVSTTATTQPATIITTTNTTTTATTASAKHHDRQSFYERESSSVASSPSDFYAPHLTSPKRYSRSSYQQVSRETQRQIMSGGEVRIQIKPHPSMASPGLDFESKRYAEADGGEKYYRYHTRTRSDLGSQDSYDGRDLELTIGGMEDPSMDDTQEFHYSSEVLDSSFLEEPYHLHPNNVVYTGTSHLNRSGTVITKSSNGSMERKYAEEVAASFNFEGFHFGLDDNYGFEENSLNHHDHDPFDAEPPSPAITRPHMYATSNFASSGVLNVNQNGTTNSNSGSPTANIPRSYSGNGSRPGFPRNISSSSYINGRSSQDEIVRELSRLSKISGGSGVSGLAIVITADGAASTKVGEDDHDTVESDEGPRWTKEEKGKGRARSSGSGSLLSNGKNGKPQQNPQCHKHSGSGVSGWTSGEQSEHGDEGTETDSDNGTSRLLASSNESKNFTGKKLKGQEVEKGVLVHEGDQRYEFVYRMRQTPDNVPILVPQYNFNPTSSFPNRNALTTPKNSSRFIARPQSAVLPPPKPRDACIIPQGDDAFDSYEPSVHSIPGVFRTEEVRRKSIVHSRSSNDIDTLVHPALRVPTSDGKRDRRNVVSMSSVEVFALTGRNSSEAHSTAGTRTSRVTWSDVPPPRSQGSSTAGNKVGLGERLTDITAALNQLEGGTANSYNNTNDKKKKSKKAELKVPRPARRIPIRPEILRRSMTPRLYRPRPLSDHWRDLFGVNLEGGGNVFEASEYRAKEARAGRIMLAMCLLFPPLLFVLAWGGFDNSVDSWTAGEVKEVGVVEKRIAMVLGSVVVVGVIAGVIVGVTLGAGVT
ncbi:hypothetical protein RUND412_009388 [Rhizina undulata]